MTVAIGPGMVVDGEVVNPEDEDKLPPPPTYSQVNRRLRWLAHEGYRVNALFEQTRLNVAATKDAMDKARRRIILSPECPKVRRNGWTVDERNAWVDMQIEGEITAYAFAEARFEAAKGLVFEVARQVSSCQTLSKNITTEMTMLGGGGYDDGRRALSGSRRRP